MYKYPHPVCSSSRTVKSPDDPLPLIREGVVRSSAPCAEARNFFWAEWALGVRERGVPTLLRDWPEEAPPLLCWKTPPTKSSKLMRPSLSVSSLSNNCCSSYMTQTFTSHKNERTHMGNRFIKWKLLCKSHVSMNDDLISKCNDILNFTKNQFWKLKPLVHISLKVKEQSRRDKKPAIIQYKT